jgi:PAS domain S-box-containing protein
MSSRSETHDDEQSAYQAIFEASSDGLVINDAETGIVLEANPAFCRMHGYDSMTGLHPTAFIHPASQHQFEAYTRAIRNGLEFRTRAQDVRRDGTIFDVEVLGRGFLYHGQFALLGVVRDVTDNVRGYLELEERVAERTREIVLRRAVAEGLRELVSVVNSGRALDDILTAIVAQSARLLGSDAEVMYLVDGDDPGLLRLHASRNIPPDAEPLTVPIGTPTMGLAVQRRRPVVAVDLTGLIRAPFVATIDEQIADRGSYLELVRRGPTAFSQTARDHGNRVMSQQFQSLVTVPLMARGIAHGSLTLAYRLRHVPSDDELELITAFASQAGLAIESARLHEQAEQRRREADRRRQIAEGLRDLVATVNSTRTLSEVLEAVTAQAARLLGSDASAIHVPDSRDGGMSLKAFASSGLDATYGSYAIPSGVSTTGLAFEKRRPVAIYDTLSAVMLDPDRGGAASLEDRGSHLQTIHLPTSAARERTEPPGQHAAGYRALLAVPLAVKDQTYGALTLYFHQSREFADDQVEVATTFADQAALAIENARLHEESERQRRELEALYQADEALHRSLRLQDVLDALVDAAVQLLGVDGGGLWGSDPKLGGRMAPLAARGLSAAYLLRSTRLNEDPVVREFWEAHESMVVEDVLSDPRIPSAQRSSLAREGLRGLLTTQVRVGTDHFGSFTVGRRVPHRFTAQEQRLLSALAQRAGLAIQNARLYEQAQQAATLEERQRLARELHDAVTQTLFSTALIAEVLPELWDIDAQKARDRLKDLRRLTRGALAEMRTLLVELRPDALTQVALGELLRQLAEAAAGRTHLEVTAHVDGPARHLPPEVHVALYRLAQEALNNVVKHAQAEHASLELAFTEEQVCLQVRDDGRGFVTSVAAPAGHFGLGMMRERAASIGARLHVASRPGDGVLVKVTWSERMPTATDAPSHQDGTWLTGE